MDQPSWQDRHRSTPFLVHLVAGSIAGLAEHLSMLPLDNLKTHCQSSTRPLLPVVRTIYRNNGLLGFYSGTTPLALGCIPAHGLYFSIIEAGHDLVGMNSAIKNSVLGAVAAFFHDLVMTPAQMLKQRVQLSRQSNPTVRASQVLKQVVREEGSRALYRSFWVSYSMNLPFASLMLPLYRRIQAAFEIGPDANPLLHGLSAALASLLASLPAAPLDLIKTRLNTVPQRSPPPSRRQLRVKVVRGMSQGSVRQAISRVYQQSGPRGFLRGVGIRALMSMPSSAVAWTSYQFFKGRLAVLY